MSHGLPDHPADDLEFKESPDDSTCPSCGWDADEALQDPITAYHQGVVLACESAEDSLFNSMGGAENLAYYFRCPGFVHTETKETRCGCYFTIETESILGGMA